MCNKSNVCKVAAAQEHLETVGGSQKKASTRLTEKVKELDKKPGLFFSIVHQSSNAVVITGAMLHLYVTVAYSGRHMGVEKRNACLIKLFKQAVKCTNYKSVKPDIRGVIHYGRNQGANLEKKMNEILSLTEKYTVSHSSDSDMALFTKLLERVNQYCHINAEVIDETVSRHENRLYLDKRNVESAFDTTGKLISQIMLLLPKKKASEVKELIENQGWKYVSSKQSDDNECTNVAVYITR